MGHWEQSGWLGLGDASGEHPVQPPAEAGSPTAGLCPGGFRISPEKDAPCSRWEAIPGRQLALAPARLSQLQFPSREE